MFSINAVVVILFILPGTSISTSDEYKPCCLPTLTNEQIRNIEERLQSGSLNIHGPVVNNSDALQEAGILEPVVVLTEEQKQIIKDCGGFGMLSEPKPKQTLSSRLPRSSGECCGQPTSFVALAASVDSNNNPVELVQLLPDLVQEFGDTNHCPAPSCSENPQCVPVQIEYSAFVITLLPGSGPSFTMTKIKVDICGAATKPI